MINSFCDTLRAMLQEHVEACRERLEKGSGGFASDERVRGEIWGLRTAVEAVDALEERARKQDDEAS